MGPSRSSSFLRPHSGAPGPRDVIAADGASTSHAADSEKSRTGGRRPMAPPRLAWVSDDACERDPTSAVAEYGAEIRTDIKTFPGRRAKPTCLRGFASALPMSREYYSAKSYAKVGVLLTGRPE